MFLPLLFSQLALAGDCSIPIPQSMFDTKLNDVEEALRNRDSDLMTQKMEQLTDSIPCLAQPVTQVQASRYHTLQGISQFLKKDIDKAQLYFSSARAANSQAEIKTDFYPEGHMIHNLFSTAPDVSDGENLDPPAKGSLLFDGLNSSIRPLYRPTIYQHIQNGKSISSSLLEPLQDTPDYITETEAKVEQSKETQKEVLTDKSESKTDAITNTKNDTTEKSSNKFKKGLINNKKTGLAMMATGLVLGSLFIPDRIALGKIVNEEETLENTDFFILGSSVSYTNIGTAGVIVNAGLVLGGTLTASGAYLYKRSDK